MAGHPRDPHKRVEAIASSRHVVVELDGVRLADGTRPVLLFETSLPTRYYLPARTSTLPRWNRPRTTACVPTRALPTEILVVTGRPDAANVVWSYSAPLPAVGKVAGRLAFYNELVDLTVDGVPQPRPRSVFSAKANRPTS